MGFDITAYGTDEGLEVTDEYGDEVYDFDSAEEVAYHRAYMGGFRMMREQGYDWFELIDAEECDGGVSGNGTTKKISVKKLSLAHVVLDDFIVNKLSSEGRDEVSERREELCEFMMKCIKWCEDNNKKSILIYFG